MKKVMYMAMSVNGFIADTEGNTPWSDEEWNSFNQAVKETGNLVIGRKTYELMKDDDTLNKFKDQLVVVVTSKVLPKNEANVSFVASPAEVMNLLEKKKYKTALLAGGTVLNSSMLNGGFIDELYLDVEPKLFSGGINLFSNDIVDLDLELMGSKKIGKNTVQLYYKVK